MPKRRSTRRPAERVSRAPAATLVSPLFPLAAMVRSRRKELGLTQEELARYAGCGLAFMYDLEKGKPSVRFDKVLDVLRVLGLQLVIADGSAGIAVEPASLRETS